MCAWIKVARNHVREAFGTAPGLFRTVQLNCSLLMSRFMKHSFYGCAPQVVLAVPQEENPHAVVVISPPVLPFARTVVGMDVKSEEVSVAQETPIRPFPVIVDSANDFGTVVEAGVFWMRMPPNGWSIMFDPLLLTVASLMSKPAPLRRMPPAVLLLTLT